MARRARPPAPGGQASDAEIKRLAQLIDSDAAKAPFGIKPDELIMYVGDRKWPIKTDAYKAKLEVAQIQDDHHTAIKKIQARGEKDGRTTFAEQVAAEREAARKVLELVIEGFSWKKEAETVDTDALVFCAADMFNFLVVAGGAAGRPRSRMLQNLDTMNRLISTRASPQNSESSSAPRTGLER